MEIKNCSTEVLDSSEKISSLDIFINETLASNNRAKSLRIKLEKRYMYAYVYQVNLSKIKKLKSLKY